MLVTLSGLDGAGKSTLAEALKASLERDGFSAVIFHMNKDVGLYAYLRNIRDRIKSLISPIAKKRAAEQAPANDTERGGGRAKQALLELRRRIIWNKPLRRWVDLGDLLLFLPYRLFVERVRGNVLIMDRYFYDRLADQADGLHWKYLRWFASITPVPDVPILVDVTPEEAFGRKGEYSIESMTLRRSNYGTIFGWLPGSVILSNAELEPALETLNQLVRDKLKQPPRQRAAAGG